MALIDIVKGPLTNMALEKLRELFGGSICALVIVQNPESTDGPLPGFELMQYDEPIEPIRKSSHDEIVEKNRTHPYRITADEKAEFERLIKFEKDLKGTKIIPGRKEMVAKSISRNRTAKVVAKHKKR